MIVSESCGANFKRTNSSQRTLRNLSDLSVKISSNAEAAEKDAESAEGEACDFMSIRRLHPTNTTALGHFQTIKNLEKRITLVIFLFYRLRA